jgi:hypothetical protein
MASSVPTNAPREQKCCTNEDTSQDASRRKLHFTVGKRRKADLPIHDLFTEDDEAQEAPVIPSRAMTVAELEVQGKHECGWPMPD